MLLFFLHCNNKYLYIGNGCDRVKIKRNVDSLSFSTGEIKGLYSQEKITVRIENEKKGET